MPVKFIISFSGDEIEAHTRITCFQGVPGTDIFSLSYITSPVKSRSWHFWASLDICGQKRTGLFCLFVVSSESVTSAIKTQVLFRMCA